MNKTEIAKLLREDVQDIVPQLAALDDAELQAVAEAEGAAKNPRESLQQAIAAAQEGRAKAAKPEKAKPKWQAPDYAGPLTIDQANWRRVNIKPAQVQGTK